MKYKKDKNIYAFENGYKIDVNTGTVFGLRGKPIQTRNIWQKFNPLFRETLSNNVLNCLRDLIRCHITDISTIQRALSTADKLDSLKLFLNADDYLTYLCIETYFTEAVNYMQNLENITEFSEREFSLFLKAKEFQKKTGCNLYEFLSKRQIHDTLFYFTECPLLEKNVDIVIYYLIKQHLYEFTDGSCSIALNQIQNYLAYCEKIQKTPVKTANFIREYVETRNDYLRYKEQYDARQLQENYEKHKKAWEFTYGNYTIVIPTCGEDIIREGQLMHHCVGTYVNRVVENITYICFVCKAASPNDCYITCQVDLNGKIGQYYLSHDRRISSEEDIAFKRAFQEYLNSVWEA